jgi:putative ABC transport system permease protein
LPLHLKLLVSVIKDFHTSSLHKQIEPLILLPFPSLFYEAGIKISSENTSATLKFIEQSWSELYPEYLFRYTFLNDYVARQYREEERMFTLFEVFAGIAIFIGCLGLYGLASFMANQKTKEVAIRKTLGASVSQIVVLFSKEFVVLVLLAFALATPVAWYAMNGWLEGFAYRTNLSWTVFIIGVLFTLIITLLTVGYRSLRAASSNPVNALKAE